MEKRKFIVCVASRIVDLEESVNRLIEQGYDLAGGMSITKQDNPVNMGDHFVTENYDVFWQPMCMRQS